MQNNNKNDNSEKVAKSRVPTWLKAIVVVVLLFLLMVVSLRLPFVQQPVTAWVANSLTNDFGFEVSIGKVNFNFINRLEIDDFLIHYENGDTLLYAERFYGTTKKPLTSLFKQSLEINDIRLDGARFNLVTDLDRPENIFVYLERRKRDEISELVEDRSARISFSIDAISAYNSTVFIEDQIIGTSRTITTEKLYISLDEIDLEKQRFFLNSMIVDGVNANMSQFEGAPVAVRDSLKKVFAETQRRDYPVFSPGIDLQVEYFELRNGKLRNKNNLREVVKTGMPVFNIDDFSISEAEVQVSDLRIDSTGITGVPDLVKFDIGNDIKVIDMNASKLSFSNEKLSLDGLRFLTEESFIDDKISLTYSHPGDFRKFVDAVEISSHFKRTEIKLSELLYFIPELRDNDFFQKNREELFKLSGDFSGYVNQFRGDDIHIEIGESFALEGSFSTRDLAIPGSELVRLQVSRLNTSMEALKNLIPDFKAPDNFYKLGDLEFSGRFDGYFRDFVADGSVKTDLGLLETDMRLDIRDGVETALYSGFIKVTDFDLARWTDNDDFGSMTFFAEVDEGMGLTSDYLYANLIAEIENFSFRNYNYANLKMDGYITQNFFDGFFSIEDEYLDFELIGSVFYGSDRFRLNAEIDLNRLNSKELNLTEREFEISGNLSADITEFNLKYPVGTLAARNLKVNIPDSLYNEIDDIFISAQVSADSIKTLQLQSDLLDFELTGVYFYDDFLDIFKKYAVENYSYASLVFDREVVDEMPHADFQYDLNIKSTKGFAWLFDQQLDTLENSRIWGFVNSREDRFRLEFSFPSLIYGQNEAETFYGLVDFDGAIGNALVTSERLQLGNLREVNPTTLFLDFGPDTIGFALNTADYSDIMDRLQISGKSFRSGDNWAFRFFDSELTIFGEDWNVKENNQLILGRQFFQTENLTFFSGDKELDIHSVNDRGVNLAITGLDISILNDLINDQRYVFGGRTNIQMEVADIFDVDALEGDVNVEDLVFQGIEYGNLRISAGLQTGPHPLQLDIRTSHPERSLEGRGFVYLNRDEVPSVEKRVDLYFDIENFPMMIFQKIIEDGISETTGTFNGQLKISGNNPAHLDMDGNAQVYNTSTKVDILGVTYFVNDQNIAITGSMIDLTDVEIQDRFGNTATLTGGLLHKNFGDLSLAASLNSGRILGLDTRRGDSDLYYGRILGQVEADFSGSFQRPDIRVTAVNGSGTNFSILVGENIESGEIDFISFEGDTLAEERAFFRDVTGVNFQLDITVNEEADLQIVFDEQTGDILRGTGNGNLQVSLTRNGDFNIYGDYVISEGKYLFANSFALLQINKPFEVLSGGSIQWTGDPFDAIIDIRANYSGLNASPYAFIEEYLQGSATTEVIAEARQSTPVDLTMLLQGYLNNPEINFTIDFPNLTGQLKTYTDRKILDLEENPDEMNRQVFALVVIGGFLPSSFTIETSVAAITNTVNEWLSTQLSLYLSDLLSNAFEDVGFISGIEMDVGYVLPTGEFVEAGRIDTRQSEVRIGLRPSLFDDRIQLDVGGNYVRESFFTSDPYLAPYGSIEYFITPDRRWRLRMTTNYDYVAEGRRNRHSVGISFRREFDSIEDFMQNIRLFEKKDDRKARRSDEGREEEGPLFEE